MLIMMGTLYMLMFYLKVRGSLQITLTLTLTLFFPFQKKNLATYLQQRLAEPWARRWAGTDGEAPPSPQVPPRGPHGGAGVDFSAHAVAVRFHVARVSHRGRCVSLGSLPNVSSPLHSPSRHQLTESQFVTPGSHDRWEFVILCGGLLASTLTVMLSMVTISYLGAATLKNHAFEGPVKAIEKYDKLVVGAILCGVGLITHVCARPEPLLSRVRLRPKIRLQNERTLGGSSSRTIMTMTRAGTSTASTPTTKTTPPPAGCCSKVLKVHRRGPPNLLEDLSLRIQRLRVQG